MVHDANSRSRNGRQTQAALRVPRTVWTVPVFRRQLLASYPRNDNSQTGEKNEVGQKRTRTTDSHQIKDIQNVIDAQRDLIRPLVKLKPMGVIKG